MILEYFSVFFCVKKFANKQIKLAVMLIKLNMRKDTSFNENEHIVAIKMKRR